MIHYCSIVDLRIEPSSNSRTNAVRGKATLTALPLSPDLANADNVTTTKSICSLLLLLVTRECGTLCPGSTTSAAKQRTGRHQVYQILTTTSYTTGLPSGVHEVLLFFSNVCR